jgi:hypothetical protein
MSLHLSHIFFTDARTFIAGCQLPVTRCQAKSAAELLLIQNLNYPATTRIVRRQNNSHSVSGAQSHKIRFGRTSRVGQHPVIIF